MTQSNNPEAGRTINAPDRHAVTRVLAERLRYEDTLKAKRAEVRKKEMEKVSVLRRTILLYLQITQKGYGVVPMEKAHVICDNTYSGQKKIR
jgi:hypothetical protein